MNILNSQQVHYVGAGEKLEESLEIKNGYLTTTLHIPPHPQEITLEVLFQLKDINDF